MTTIEALQTVYVSRGGSFEDVENLTTIPEMINAINEIIEDKNSPITSDEIDEIINSIQ